MRTHEGVHPYHRRWWAQSHARLTNVRAIEDGMDASPRRAQTNFISRQDASSTLKNVLERGAPAPLSVRLIHDLRVVQSLV